MGQQGAPPADQPAPERIVYVQPALTPGRIMLLTLAVLFVIGVVWFIIQVRQIVLILIMGILIATAIEPVVNRLRRYGFARGPVILIIYALVFVAIGVILLLALPPLYEQGVALLSNAPQYAAEIQERVANSPSVLVRRFGTEAMDRVSRLVAEFAENPPIQAVQAAEFVTSFFGLLFTIVSLMIVTFYWMTEKAAIKRFVLSLVPLARRDRAHQMWDEIESKAGGWARGQVILMLVIGVISTAAYSPLGFNLPFWVFLGIWAGLMEAIPFIGPWLGGGLAVMIAFTDSWQKALLVAAFVVVINQAEASILVPRVMRNAVGLSPLSVILAVLVGGAILGPIGAILSIPVAAVVQVLVQGILRERQEAEEEELVASRRQRAVPTTAAVPAREATEPTVVEITPQEIRG